MPMLLMPRGSTCQTRGCEVSHCLRESHERDCPLWPWVVHQTVFEIL